jgi:hypothetical protein
MYNALRCPVVHIKPRHHIRRHECKEQIRITNGKYKSFDEWIQLII